MVFKNIIHAKFNTLHFIIVVLIAALVTWGIVYALPVFMWLFIEGDGPHPENFYVWDEMLYYAIPVIVTYPFVIIPAIINYRKGNYSATKNYILATFVVIWVEVLALNVLLK